MRRRTALEPLHLSVVIVVLGCTSATPGTEPEPVTTSTSSTTVAIDVGTRYGFVWGEPTITGDAVGTATPTPTPATTPVTPASTPATVAPVVEWTAARSFDEDDGGKTVTVAPGVRFDVSLAKTRNPLAEHDFTWEDPLVTGDAVTLVGNETVGPPADVDGGSFTLVSRYQARTAGKATITIRRTPGPGSDVPASPFVLRVRVK